MRKGASVNQLLQVKAEPVGDAISRLSSLRVNLEVVIVSPLSGQIRINRSGISIIVYTNYQEKNQDASFFYVNFKLAFGFTAKFFYK